MSASLDATLNRLSSFAPLHDFKFGHTPLQMEYFQVSNQQGNEKWEYWQHVLQLRALYATLKEMNISQQELDYEIEDALCFWPPWTRTKRKRSLPRLELKKEQTNKSIREKEQEALCHLDIIDKKYSHLKELKEEDILKEETSYWTLRLGRQLGAAHMSRVLGIPEGEILAVLSLPKEQQRQVFESMRLLIGASATLLPQSKVE